MLITEATKEKELFTYIAEGDEEAFRQLFHIYMPQLYPMILKVTRIKSVAEDILQETFLRLWITRDKLPGIENPRAWILRIAYLQAFTFLSKKAIHEKALNKLSQKARDQSLRNGTEETISFDSLQELVRRAVSELPGQAKKVYVLSREEGLKTAEIARELNLSEQTVKNTLGRALKFIRTYVEKAGYTLFFIALFLELFLKEQ